MGQRLFYAIVPLFLLGIAVILGANPGDYPTLPDGSILTPEVFWQMAQAVLVPLGAFIMALVGVFGAVNRRIENGDVQPGQILALFRLRETWIYAIAVIASISSLFGIKFLDDEGTQVALASFLQIIAASLLNTYAQRPNGSDPAAAIEFIHEPPT